MLCAHSKREHEEKVSRAAAQPSSPFSFEIRGREKPITINRLTTGDEVLALLGRGYSRMHTTPPGMSSIQREKVGDFLQNAFDWSEIVGEIGPRGELEAGGQLQEEIDGLAIEGILVYGAVRVARPCGSGLHPAGLRQPSRRGPRRRPRIAEETNSLGARLELEAEVASPWSMTRDKSR